MRLFYLFICLFPFAAHAVIHEVRTMEEVASHCEEADSSTLVGFDIDGVLLQSADPYFQLANMKKHSVIAKKIFGELNDNERITFFALETVRSYPVIIESHAAQLLQDLDDRHIKRIAITANLTGSFDGIEKMQDWTSARLTMCGLDFASSFPRDGELIFPNLPTYRGNYMLFYKGILFSNGSGMGKACALTAFLNQVNFEPKTFIFIDDRLENLKMMELLLSDRIEFVGLHYRGALDYPSPCVDAESFEKVWKERAEEAKKLTETAS